MDDLATLAGAGAQRLVGDIERPLSLTARIAFSDTSRGLRVSMTVEPVKNVGGSVELDASQITNERVCYELARLVQEGILTETGRIWPALSADSRQPLVPGPTGWCDLDTGEHVMDYGNVRWAPDRRPVPDGEVRWWIDYLDFGVIASDSGDLAFTYFDIRPDSQGRRSVPSTAQQVGYTVSDASRGVYRAATAVFAS